MLYTFQSQCQLVALVLHAMLCPSMGIDSMAGVIQGEILSDACSHVCL